MSVEQRIRMCLLIERIENHKLFGEKLGMENASKFRGEMVNRKEGKEHVDHIV